MRGEAHEVVAAAADSLEFGIVLDNEETVMGHEIYTIIIPSIYCKAVDMTCLERSNRIPAATRCKEKGEEKADGHKTLCSHGEKRKRIKNVYRGGRRVMGLRYWLLRLRRWFTRPRSEKGITLR